MQQWLTDGNWQVILMRKCWIWRRRKVSAKVIRGIGCYTSNGKPSKKWLKIKWENEMIATVLFFWSDEKRKNPFMFMASKQRIPFFGYLISVMILPALLSNAHFAPLEAAEMENETETETEHLDSVPFQPNFIRLCEFEWDRFLFHFYFINSNSFTLWHDNFMIYKWLLSISLFLVYSEACTTSVHASISTKIKC